MTFRDILRAPAFHATTVVAIVAIAWVVAGHWNSWTGAARYQRTDDAYCDVGDQAETSSLYDLPGKPPRNHTDE